MNYIFIKVCGDVYDKCDQWAAIDKCDTNPEFMLRYCRKACKECAPTYKEQRSFLLLKNPQPSAGRTYSFNSEAKIKF